MGFYYFSILSLVPLGVAYGLLALVYWGIERTTRRIPRRGLALAVIGAVFLVLPISEEIWIAWNFGQSCKDAGTFVHKKVQVDGFYDDLMPWGERQLAESDYRFVESRDSLHDTILRVERVRNGIKLSKIDRPTAKYQFKSLSHVPEAHGVVKHDATVIDSETKEILGRELNYARHAPWFFIGLDAPTKICAGKRNVKGMLYENVLFPKSIGGEGETK